MDHLPGSVESMKQSGWHKDHIEDDPPGAFQSLGHQIEIDLPDLGEMKHLEMEDQEEGQEDPGDPLKKPAVSTRFSRFLVHKSCSFEEVNGLELEANLALLLLSQGKNLSYPEQKSTKKLRFFRNGHKEPLSICRNNQCTFTKEKEDLGQKLLFLRKHSWK